MGKSGNVLWGVLLMMVMLLLAACAPVRPAILAGGAPALDEATTTDASASMETGVAADTGVDAGDHPDLNGIQLYYEIHGDGPPLLLLHGGLGNASYWMNQIPVLAEQFQVIAVDSRGHGRSTFDEQPITYALMASDVLALMDQLGIDKADLVGWSDGGIIGLDLAINHPERLNKVVAYGANYNPSGVRADIGANETFNAYIEMAAEDYQTTAPDPTKWDAFLANIGNMWATEPNYTPEQLAAITTSILVLDGEEEEAIDINHAREMAGLIPGAELHLIPGTGHFAMWEKPEEFNQIVLDYLAK